MSRKGELRRHPRSAHSDLIHIVWKDRQGIDKFAKGAVVDVSESGIRIELPEPLEKHSYVTLQCRRLGLHGSASVRSCTRNRVKYVIGLEFAGGLKWKHES